MKVRQAILWSGLLFGSQTTDALTTAVDRTRGAIETMPVSAQLLEVGGPAMFWAFKLFIVATVAVALLTAAGLVRDGHRLSQLTFHVSLIAVQAATICLAFVSLSNLTVLS
ncbi:MAG TPA: hypothetical protein VNA65_10250 [Candidatus Dormibacteraeota bacterium]|nr:hypothetical protein [Candidatus Dormibacteraeota bacterium]